MGGRSRKKAASQQNDRRRAEKQTIICLATGPSLSADDCAAIQGKAQVIAVNDAYKLAPRADIVYACDARWWFVHGEQVMAAATGERWIQHMADQVPPDKLHADAAQKFGLRVVRGREGVGLGRDVIHFGSNSGYQAINLAYLRGATRIVLLGYDMQHTGGAVHFFGDHPEQLHNGPDFNSIIPKFKALAADLAAEGVEVINCTRQTALPYFRRAALEDVLPSLSAPARASMSMR